ncbi:MAG: DUF58 domain-containing protein [Paenisporosarcina sp.]
MIWKRDYYGAAQTKWVLLVLGFLFVFSLLLMNYVVAGVFAFLGTIASLQFWYFRQVGKRLVMQNEKNRSRLLVHGHSSWTLEFENPGMPIWNGQLRLHFQNAVNPIYPQSNAHGQLNEVLVPFTIGYNEKIVLNIPVQGAKRGISKLKDLELTIPHLFGEGSIVMTYQPIILMDQMVFPNIFAVKELRHPSPLKPGSFEMKHSIFNDVFSPIGTRDYVPSDQFHHIHWKASARLQKLQTKVFTPIANESVMLIVNIAQGYSIISDLEEKIEVIASIIDFYYREGIPYSIVINVRAFGQSPYLFIQTGDGQKQRQKSMELLSILSKNDLTMPFNRMLSHLEIHEEFPMSVIIFTHDEKEAAPYIVKWQQKTKVLVYGDDRKGGEIQWKKDLIPTR